jgi:hypothetical protein
MNHLSHIDNSMGFWIQITDPAGAEMVIYGEGPSASQKIHLKKGWNLIGYPSTTIRLRDDALNNLEFGSDISIIQWYDAVSSTHRTLNIGDTMEPGKGYIFFANQDCTWTIEP